MTEQLNVIEGGKYVETLTPITKPAEFENKVNITTLEIPANKLVNQPIIQPIYEKDNLEI